MADRSDTYDASRISPRTWATAFCLLATAGLSYAALAWRAAGAGVDPDAWRLLLTGLNLWGNGEYAASRPPGFPVVELIAAVTVPLGLTAMKLLTAGAGASCVALTYLLVVPVSHRAALTAAVILLVTPGMILASTSTMDYTWSLGFMLLGLVLAQRGRLMGCGIALGLATACRFTAIAALPIAWLMLPAGGCRVAGRTAWQSLFRIALPLAAVCTLFYGWAALSDPRLYGDGMGRARFVRWEDLGPVSHMLFGHVGAVTLSLVVAMATCSALIRRWRKRRPSPEARWASGSVLAFMMIVFAGLYALAAYEPLYLLPMLPPLACLLAVRLRRPVAVALIAALLLSGWRDVSPDGIVIYGVVAQDVRDRDRSAGLTRWLLGHPPSPPALVIAGSRAPEIEFTSRTTGPALPKDVRIGNLLRANLVKAERRPNERLCCLKDMLVACRERGFDPISDGAEIWWPTATGETTGNPAEDGPSVAVSESGVAP